MVPKLFLRPVTSGLTENSSTQSRLERDKVPSMSEEMCYQWEIVWRNVIIFSYLHIAAIVGLYMFIVHATWATVICNVICSIMVGQGITAGAHRLWSHKSYKAKLPLRIFLAFCQAMAFQNHIYEWARDHRVHHKFTDTDADPHNAKRGFFFSHVGWLLIKKHRDVKIKGKTIDMSDLEADPVVRFQRKYYYVLMPLSCFILPTMLPWYCCNENVWIAYHACIFRYCLNLNGTWLVNSAAHMFGSKPYDRYIKPSQNSFVSMLTFGEGFHNYHHVFPWDYKADELGFQKLNFTAGFIEFFAKIGWAYDLKTAPPEIVRRRKRRTGETSVGKMQVRPSDSGGKEELIWGWGDKALPKEDRQAVNLHNHLKDD